jgi:methylglyoxal synthase
LKGADPVAGVEMASTGEVACFGADLEEAFYTSWLATEQNIKGKNVYISLPDEQKHKFLEEAASLIADGWKIYSTEGTHLYFKKHGIKTTRLYKIIEKKEPSVASWIENRKLDLMVNVPTPNDPDNYAYTIRRLAIDNHIPLMTNAETGRLLLKCLSDEKLKHIEPKYWKEYLGA